MSQMIEVMTYHVDGREAGVVKGEVLDHHGPRHHCKNGRVIEAADIIPAEGGQNRTVYLDVTTIPA